MLAYLLLGHYDTSLLISILCYLRSICHCQVKTRFFRFDYIRLCCLYIEHNEVWLWRANDVTTSCFPFAHSSSHAMIYDFSCRIYIIHCESKNFTLFHLSIKNLSRLQTEINCDQVYTLKFTTKPQICYCTTL